MSDSMGLTFHIPFVPKAAEKLLKGPAENAGSDGVLETPVELTDAERQALLRATAERIQKALKAALK